MGVKLQSSSGGSVEIAAPVTASNYVLTAPAATANIGIDGPAFRAYCSSSQSITGSVVTKIQFNSELFDTNNCFDSTTNYRFTPNVAGYYQINAIVYFQGSAGAFSVIQPFKNGGQYANINTQISNGNYNSVCWSDIVYFNGVTDYMEIYAYENVTSSTNTGSGASLFSGCLLRSA